MGTDDSRKGENEIRETSLSNPYKLENHQLNISIGLWSVPTASSSALDEVTNTRGDGRRRGRRSLNKEREKQRSRPWQDEHTHRRRWTQNYIRQSISPSRQRVGRGVKSSNKNRTSSQTRITVERRYGHEKGDFVTYQYLGIILDQFTSVSVRHNLKHRSTEKNMKSDADPDTSAPSFGPPPDRVWIHTRPFYGRLLETKFRPEKASVKQPVSTASIEESPLRFMSSTATSTSIPHEEGSFTQSLAQQPTTPIRQKVVELSVEPSVSVDVEPEPASSVIIMPSVTSMKSESVGPTMEDRISESYQKAITRLRRPQDIFDPSNRPSSKVEGRRRLLREWRHGGKGGRRLKTPAQDDSHECVCGKNPPGSPDELAADIDLLSLGYEF